MQVFTFTLTVDEANMVIAGLNELPAKHSMAIIQKMQTQATEQQQAQEADTVPKTK